MDHPASPPAQTINSTLRLFDLYQRSPYLSLKHDSYFQVYEQLLARYVGRKITFVEVGVLNGGSLFMWREYFGPEARIIGIDLNPAARQWQSAGFEIFIGSQSDPQFWRDFYAQVGNVDVLLDDGGHTNRQQIITVHESLPHVNDDGLIVVEDVHASYMREFGNPSRFSFVNFAKHLADGVNSRSGVLAPARSVYPARVYSVSFFESIVALQVDSRRCFRSQGTANGGVSENRQDFRLKDSKAGAVEDARARLRRHSLLRRSKLLTRLGKAVFFVFDKIAFAIEDRKLKRFFD